MYQTIGAYPSQSNGRNYFFNSRNGFFVIYWAHMGVLSAVFMIFKAKSLDEFGISFHITTSIAAGLYFFVTYIFQIKNILKLIEKFEEFIEKSYVFNYIFRNSREE